MDFSIGSLVLLRQFTLGRLYKNKFVPWSTFSLEIQALLFGGMIYGVVKLKDDNGRVIELGKKEEIFISETAKYT